jgi:hypothetical protein
MKIPYCLLMFWAFLMDRLIQLGEKKTVPASPGLRPEESERPALLPHKLDPVTPDRPTYFASPADELGFRMACSRAVARLRKVNEEIERDRKVAEDIEELLGEVREGDTRG